MAASGMHFDLAGGRPCLGQGERLPGVVDDDRHQQDEDEEDGAEEEDEEDGAAETSLYANEDPLWVSVPGAEPRHTLQRRGGATLGEMAATHPSEAPQRTRKAYPQRPYVIEPSSAR